jgi:hypothetical protein
MSKHQVIVIKILKTYECKIGYDKTNFAYLAVVVTSQKQISEI